MNTKVSRKWRGYCVRCGYGELKTNARKFCSLECHRRYKDEQNTMLLEAGQYPPTMQTHGFIKKYLMRKLGQKCARCGWAERHPKTGKIPIEVEHIDGNWRNNHPSNLTLLCPNCHSLTPTYRALNRGNGREFRVGSRRRDHMAALKAVRAAQAEMVPKVERIVSVQIELL